MEIFIILGICIYVVVKSFQEYIGWADRYDEEKAKMEDIED